MDFEIQVTQSVAETEESAWDRLSGGRHYASHRWYRFCEAVLEDCPPTYVILSRAKEQGASIVVFGYTASREARHPGWPGNFLPVSYPDAETSLEIAWPDFESYPEQLAQSTRRNYKLHGKRAAGLGIEVESRPAVTDIEAALALIRNVETHHRVGHRPWAREMLENAALVDSTWITARLGSRLVGCCSLFGENTYQLATLLGLDYSIPDSVYAYYQIIYTAVRCAIERGAKVLYGGSGAYELKRRLGFRMLPDDYLLAAGIGRISRWLVRGLARWTGGREAVDGASNEAEQNRGETNHEL